MQVSRSPMARATRTAATDESTPPLKAQMARPLPTVSLIEATVSSMKRCGVHEGCAPQMPENEIPQQLGTQFVCGGPQE